MKNSLLNTFTLQSLISVAPAIFIIPLMPFYLKFFTTSFLSVGFLFFLIRMSGLSGTLFSGALRQFLDSRRLCILGELISAFACIIMYFSLEKNFLLIFLISLVIRYFFLSLIMIVRVQWLKELPSSKVIEKTFMITNILFQAGFGLTGIVLLYFKKEELALVALTIDAISSLVGATLFYFGDKIKTSEKRIPRQNLKEKMLELLHHNTKRLLLIELLVAAGIAGTNVLLLQFGNKHLNEYGGYSLSLILYSSFYILGGLFVTSWIDKGKIDSLKKAVKIASLGLFLSLSITLYNHTFVQIIAFSSLFIFYALFMICIQQLWFLYLSKNSATAVFGLRSTIIGLIWAFGEIFYDGLNQEIPIRIMCFLSATIMAILIIPKLTHLNAEHKLSS